MQISHEYLLLCDQLLVFPPLESIAMATMVATTVAMVAMVAMVAIVIIWVGMICLFRLFLWRVRKIFDNSLKIEIGPRTPTYR